MMVTRFVYGLFVRLFAHRLVKAAYRGVLAREADAEGLATYKRGLIGGRDLSWLIAELVSSDELRGNVGLPPHETLVNSAFHAVLRRTPTGEELAAHVARLKSGQAVDQLLAEVSAGRSANGSFAPDDAEFLVRSAFIGLLDREPELEAVKAYSHLLLDTGDVTGFLKEVGHSAEHIAKLRLDGRRQRALPAN